MLKQRLLSGALRLQPEETREQGAGQLLGRVIEAQAIEGLALAGGFAALTAGLELLLAAAILSTVSFWLGALLMACVGATGAIAWPFFHRRWTWTAARLSMTHDLVERMVGHRTRLAQERRETWHDAEDRSLAQYVESSRAMDAAATRLTAIVPRGWVLVAVAALSVPFVSGGASPAALAVALGGILLAHTAFRRLTSGATSLVDAAIAWAYVAPAFHAAARARDLGVPAYAVPQPTTPADTRLWLDGRELSFRYSSRPEPILRGCSLQLRRGDRVLLGGRTGGGKSTLVSLLSGLRTPDSGVLLVEDLDRRTLGDAGWRRRIVTVPQFHENHVFTGTLAFNLLMGAKWPPTREDLKLAHEICGELGLQEVLARMPGGLWQQVGETGWQLSHGERSRLFIARGLLQESGLVVLDESLAQLDPRNAQRAVACVLKRAASVLIVAHQ